jgi:phenylalanyl-tRNA synthetase beta chain
VLFSLDWLLSLCPVERDVESVARTLTSRGLTVDAVSAAGDDWALEVDVPANRPDCLGHLGLARELSAAQGVALAAPYGSPGHDGSDPDWVHVSIEDRGLCPRYTATLVRGVKIQPSPDWVVRRLEVCGLRSINNVVDASNVVLLELGHPIHFFDHARLRSEDGIPRIVVRLAKTGEKLETLDGVERILDGDTLVIADAMRPIALAGVIGGAESEITDATRDVLIEAARFSPVSVRATARRLGVQTDASFRFERGVDPETTVTAQVLAVRLLTELAQGRPDPGWIDAYPGRREASRLRLRGQEVRRLLGYQPGSEAIEAALRALQLEPSVLSDGRFEVVVPSWRIDLEQEADLVEEVARHLGYDEIPSGTVLLDATRGRSRTPPSERARDVLASLGFHEAFGYAMIGKNEDDGFVGSSDPPAIELRNPIAETMSHLRRSILPGLLRAAGLNLRRGTRDVRLFECGHVFLAPRPGAVPREPSHLGIAWAGAPAPSHWSHGDRELDLYDLMGVVERVLDGLKPGIELNRLRPATLSAFHPLNSFAWRSPAGEALAWGGALHPEVQQRIDAAIFLAELDLDAVDRQEREAPRYAEIPRVPAVTRDLALVMTAERSFTDVLGVMVEVPSPAPVEFAAIDRYVGPPLAEGEISLTLRLTLKPLEKTLTDPETESYRLALVERLKRELGVTIRA